MSPGDELGSVGRGSDERDCFKRFIATGKRATRRNGCEQGRESSTARRANESAAGGTLARVV